MTSPLTETRKKKQKMLRDIIKIGCDLIMLPKGSLDLMNFRILKKTVKNLKDLYERAKPP